MWQMKFNPKKCQVIRSNFNKRFERQSNYRLHGNTLEVVDSEKNFSVHMSRDFYWYTYIDATAAKASTAPSFLRRNMSECIKQVKSSIHLHVP